MVGLLLVLFVVVPLIELFVLIQIGSAIGALATLGLLLGITAIGVALVKGQGLHTVRRARAQLDQGEVPADEMLDGLLLMTAGALLIVPGFVTAVLGLLLLIPPLRTLVRHWLTRRFRHRLAVSGASFGAGAGFTPDRRVYDVQSVGDVTPPEWRSPGPVDGPRPELGQG